MEERAILVGVVRPGVSKWEVEEALDELGLLAETAGAAVVERAIQKRQAIDPTFFVGEGKAHVLAELCKKHGSKLVLFDDDPSPAQLQNLEEVVPAKIVGRSGLILDIFATRARSKQAKAQVELAQLTYLLPRLSGRWQHLSRQEGGIGTRGPGERQLEIDRRRVRARISVLTDAVEKIGQRYREQRKRRSSMFTAALVGYTNAGKSTLFNAVSSAEVPVDDRLFVTLDATTRLVNLSAHRQILLSDTVGFIKKLPHDLVASFHTTLEEVEEVDLLVHVVDASHPGMAEQVHVVNRVLDDMGVSWKPTLVVLNKIDKLADAELTERLLSEYRANVAVSALSGIGLSEFKEKLAGFVEKNWVEVELCLPQSDGRALADIYRHGEVLARKYEGDDVFVRVRMERGAAQRARKELAQ